MKRPFKNHQPTPTRLSAAMAPALLALGISAAPGQDYRDSMASDATLEAHAAQVESRPYTIKTGDFRLLLRPQLGFDYNDNISVSGATQEDDFILRPALAMTASYPIGKRNVLYLNATIGYDQYFQNTEYSYFRLDSGSWISFDVFVKEFMFNFHDRFSYTHDPGMESSVANAPQYGGFDNTIGVSVTRDWNDFVPTLGFDHQNYISSDDEYTYMNRSTELFSGRAGYAFLPTLTAGLEATGSLTAYDEPYLNDNTGISGGVYSDYRPSQYLGFTAKAGYSAYYFDQTSVVMPAVDQDAWYLSLGITHSPIEALSYSLSGGHELRLGQQADAVEAWYCRANINWHIIKRLKLGTSLSYENASQGMGQRTGGGVSEDYDHWSTGISMAHEITKKLNLSLNYRLSFRSSSGSGAREYTQNQVGLLLTYSLQ